MSAYNRIFAFACIGREVKMASSRGISTKVTIGTANVTGKKQPVIVFCPEKARFPQLENLA